MVPRKMSGLMFLIVLGYLYVVGDVHIEPKICRDPPPEHIILN
jgi:hypothetical protein